MLKLTFLRSSDFRFVLSILALAFLFMVPDVVACHKGKPHGQETCGGSGSDPPPSLTETVAALYGDIIRELTPPGEAGRPCDDGDIFTVEQGSYECRVSEHPALMIDTYCLTGIFHKKAERFCKSLSHHIFLMPSQSGYQYGWVDSCLDGSCDIEIRSVFEGQQILSQTEDKADLLDVVMHARVDTSLDDPLDSNPFFHARDVEIEFIEMEFNMTGGRRPVANCVFHVPMASEVHQVPARFVSVPILPAE